MPQGDQEDNGIHGITFEKDVPLVWDSVVEYNKVNLSRTNAFFGRFTQA